MVMQQTFSNYVFLLLLLLVVAMLALSTLGSTVVVYQQQEQTTIDWLNGQHANIQPGLSISPHALKHGQEAGDIYIYLLTGHCTASTTWCGASDIEKMHVCQLTNGLVGAILQFGDEITTGYWGKDGYWERRVTRDNWEVCK